MAKELIPSEHQEQVAVVNRCRQLGLLIMAIPNGGYRSKIAGSILKKEGALAGAPDLCLCLGMGQTIWIEMKRRKGGVLSDAQKKIHEDMRQLGHQIIVAKGAKDAFDQLKELGIGV